MDNKHEAFNTMPREQQEAAAQSSQSAQNRASGSRQPENEYKYVLVKSLHSNDKRVIQVIEDSGTTSNFISRDLIERLGLECKRGSFVIHETITGEKFESLDFVELKFCGARDQGFTSFYAAPPSSSIEGLVVGKTFLQDNPGVLWDQPPDSKVFLTVQKQIKKGEREEIAAAAVRMREQSAQIARLRQQQQQYRGIFPPSPPSFTSLSSQGPTDIREFVNKTDER
ncbi:uncharacterized protein BCR38DRAFT_27002 [Pseudomassariella vexata]|uniref:Uncharacterized protein n=1 Tax=Pseudomassariella vexata TaxID=1141098 RepID=A0A1Y2EKM3_9PEZI|nr:uncharacterized protein BCR38DRAFT_27002 [Pseudomassariella vexata]ORY72089.1 hypothetical protein BCR38DRAFT_27002 [Pseudomassariella vexata]